MKQYGKKLFTDEELEAIIDYKSGQTQTEEQLALAMGAFEKHRQLKESAERHMRRVREMNAVGND